MDSPQNSTRLSKKINSQPFLNYSKNKNIKERIQALPMKLISSEYPNQGKTQKKRKKGNYRAPSLMNINSKNSR